MGKEGLGRVVMGLNGCRGMHIHTANKKNKQTEAQTVVQGTILARLWDAKLLKKA